MTSNNFLTAIELIAIFSIYCALFCPILCWAISIKVPSQNVRNRLDERAQ